MLLPILGKSTIWLWFKANQDWIATNLCENRNNKKADLCKGCCYLDKQLKKVDGPAPSNTESNNNKKLQGAEDWVYLPQQKTCVPLKQTSFCFSLTVEAKLQTKHLQKRIKPPSVA
jgi:hypothetical protein